MTTRELIEEVHRVESFMGSPSVNGVRIPTACVRSTDYDALRAATVAVLDDLIACRGEHGGWRVAAGDNGPMALNKVLPNARALREKLK